MCNILCGSIYCSVLTGEIQKTKSHLEHVNVQTSSSKEHISGTASTDVGDENQGCAQNCIF